MRTVVFLALLAATLPAATVRADNADDKRVAQQIGMHLKQSGQLHNYNIGVKFQNGVAALAGTVTSAEQRDAAIRLAEEVDGVSRVVNKIEVPNDIEPAMADDSRSLRDEFQQAKLEASQPERSGVMHAYGQAMPGQSGPNFGPRMAQNGASMNRAPMPRRNMPLPAGPMPGMMAMRPGSTGVYPAGGACAGCQGGPAPMGPGGPCGPCGPGMGAGPGMSPAPVGFVPASSGRGPSYENAQMPGYAWPSYASYPNYAALSYPKQYSPTAWPYIGPFYPYPQVPLAWRKVSLEWDDGWWFLDFSAHNSSH
jgi:hypothetical protein